MFTLPPLFTAWWGAVTKASDASLGWVTTCAVLASGMLTYVAGIVRQQVGTRWMYVVATVLMLVSLAVVLVTPRLLPSLMFGRCCPGHPRLSPILPH
ncbi:hypothetical protein HMPREF9595_00528 [Cutibacterium acnes HL005PA2]|nr:hypothetical protein HMPREF9595_00528 [Cutibacterium acnes HL005PA2]